MNELPEKASPNFNWYVWNIVQRLDFIDRSHIQVSLVKERDVWDKAKRYSWGNYYWIHCFVLLLSIISLLTHWQYIVTVSKTYDKLKTKFQPKSVNKSHLKGLNKQKAKIHRKNKDYKRQMSGMSNSGLNRSGYIGDNNQNEELSFLERSGIGKNTKISHH